ncbi:hypothetical protein C453_01710 [Haloferax elongans ATCC BAA-1513]|uniref:Uncharacterized protein n=1 Tax=Haloferax elongans ATCC BAA-1513 TaxID=1230453 RepID=M0HX18_HALEO|nr:hypothetical protein C453_01710 [Haloferax elongans ATCC BAA-1513]
MSAATDVVTLPLVLVLPEVVPSFLVVGVAGVEGRASLSEGDDGGFHRVPVALTVSPTEGAVSFFGDYWLSIRCGADVYAGGSLV